MTRAVVCVATTERYQRGMRRLGDSDFIDSMRGYDRIAAGWPAHSDIPYGFKPFALREMSEKFDLLLWCDACILPIRSLEPLWERIERDGYWMSRNGFSNYEWTADSAYPDLFPNLFDPAGFTAGTGHPETDGLISARLLNRQIPHVVATAFGLHVKHPKGKAFLDEYYRLASETRAFCGPWINLTNGVSDNPRTQPCGPPDVRGHRHDQTAASVIAWRLGFELTAPPEIFAYRGGESEATILVADGSYA